MDTADERAREDLYRVVCSSERRAGQFKRAQLPHRRIAWPERDLLPGGTAEDYRTARKEGTRTFTLWREPGGDGVFARGVTVSTSQQQGAEYEVRDGGGAPLAVIRREPASFRRLRRSRWSVRQLDRGDRPAAVGRKGRLGWWWVWLPLRPFQYLFVVFTLGAFNGVEAPRRIRFRSGRQVVLDYRGVYEDLEVLADWWDPRVTVALLVLIHSWESDLGGRLDHRSFV